MKTLFLITLFLTLPALVSAETVNYDDLVWRNGLFYKKFSDVPFTGKMSGQSEIGIYLRTYKDGKPHGLSEWYYESGQLKYKTTYKDGKEHGTFEVYQENGQLMMKVNYIQGEQDFGSLHCFSESGEEKVCGS